MSYQLFSATGCSRCKIVKSFMDEKGIGFEELDIKAEGKEAFKNFYREHRPKIFRGDEGVEFPILFTGDLIFQGAGVILSFLAAEDRLCQFITRSDLSHGWISGLNIHAAGFENQADDARAFCDVVAFLHSHGLMVRLEADGRNPEILKILLDRQLIKRLVFYLKGPSHLYESITGLPLAKTDLKDSLALLNDSLDYEIVLSVSAFIREDGKASFLTPEEAADAARLVEAVTGSKKHPFVIQPVTPQDGLNINPLAPPAFFKYRTQCRRYMVMCEIMKT
jgi:glutaredoxin